jgi:hypothetical protein
MIIVGGFHILGKNEKLGLWQEAFPFLQPALHGEGYYIALLRGGGTQQQQPGTQPGDRRRRLLLLVQLPRGAAGGTLIK